MLFGHTVSKQPGLSHRQLWLTLFFLPPAVLDYYSGYMAGHMYSFCFLITLKFFQGKTEQAYSCLMGFFGQRSENYSE